MISRIINNEFDIISARFWIFKHHITERITAFKNNALVYEVPDLTLRYILYVHVGINVGQNPVAHLSARRKGQANLRCLCREKNKTNRNSDDRRQRDNYSFVGPIFRHCIQHQPQVLFSHTVFRFYCSCFYHRH